MTHLSLEEFRTRIINSGLLTELEEKAELSAHNAIEPSATAETYAKFLVKTDVLTTWQAKQLYRGRMKSLVLGNYVLLDKLGQGGMGMVFKAEHRIMQRIVAVKTLSPDIAKSPQLIARFRREVQVAAKLEHPNIVTAYDAANDGKIHYLVMQYVEGEDLASHVHKRGVLKVNDATGYLKQAAQGLRYAHEQGVIHRDIKPSNLLLDTSGTVRVLDMGLARNESLEEKSSDLTASGAVMGTIDYMSPEQAENTRTADARSDIYSLGCTLYFMLTGRPTFQGESIVQRILAHRDSEIPSLHSQVENSPPKLDQIFQKMVAKNPSHRFQKMSEVIAAIEDLGIRQSMTNQLEKPHDQELDNFLFTLNTERASTDTKKKTVTAIPNSRGDVPQREESDDDDFRLNSRLDVVAQPSNQKPRSQFFNNKSLVGFIGMFCLIGLSLLLLNGNKNHNTVSEKNDPSEESEILDHQPESIQDSTRVAIESDHSERNSNEVNRLFLRFDGVDDYVEIPQLALNDESPRTIEAWLTPFSATDTANPVMLMGTHWMTIYQTGPQWGVGKLNGERSLLIKNMSQSSQTNALMHIAGVWDGSECRLYINGQLMNTNQNSYPLQQTLSGVYFGGAPSEQMGLNAPDRFFDGQIHQVRISRNAVYNESFSPPNVLSANDDTLGLYLLNEAEGVQVQDLSGNENHGTIHGAVWGRE